MTPENLITLSMKEQQALQALMAKRDVYHAEGNFFASQIMGVACWLVWQVFKREHKSHE